MAIRKGALSKLAVPLVSVVLALALAEGAARVLAVATGRDRLIILDERLGWVLRPGVKKKQAQEQEYVVEINSHGLRNAEVRYERDPGLKRVLVLGDSFAFGFGGVEADERFTEYLERQHPGLEVINSGVPSYEPAQEYLFLTDQGLRYNPDLVILTLFANDYNACFSPFDKSIGRPKGHVTLEDGSLVFHPPEFPWLYILSQRSYLFGILDNRLGLRYHWAKPAPPMDDEEKVEAFRQLIAKMEREVRAAGAYFAAVYFPAPENDKGVIPCLMLDLARDNGFPFEDLRPEFAPGAERSPLYFRTDPHFNAAGHALAAKLIDQRIVTPVLYSQD